AVGCSDGKTVAGPVGANVSISATQATAGATFTLGWAAQSDGCVNASAITNFSDSAATVTADSSGNFTATVVWPGDAGTPGAQFAICATDTGDPTDVITAAQTFQVLGSSAPAISLSQAPSSTQSRDSYPAGGPVQVEGT